MICRGPGFLAVDDLAPRPPPLPPLPSERETTCSRERGEGVGEEPNLMTPRSLALCRSSLLSEKPNS
jgi:hypothetical protein